MAWNSEACPELISSSIGVFQTTYEQTLLSDHTPSQISWIFTFQLSLIWFSGPLFGRIVDTYGPRPVMIPCSILCIFSLCMTSLSTKYYQIILAQGIGYGFGAGGVFTASIVCVGQWFVKRRGLALGITVGGSSIGKHTSHHQHGHHIDRLWYQAVLCSRSS